jgi:hypothetical protein
MFLYKTGKDFPIVRHNKGGCRQSNWTPSFGDMFQVQLVRVLFHSNEFEKNIGDQFHRGLGRNVQMGMSSFVGGWIISLQRSTVCSTARGMGAVAVNNSLPLSADDDLAMPEQ